MRIILILLSFLILSCDTSTNNDLEDSVNFSPDSLIIKLKRDNKPNIFYYIDHKLYFHVSGSNALLTDFLVNIDNTSGTSFSWRDPTDWRKKNIKYYLQKNKEYWIGSEYLGLAIDTPICVNFNINGFYVEDTTDLLIKDWQKDGFAFNFSDTVRTLIYKKYFTVK